MKETIEQAADSYAATANPSYFNGDFDKHSIADAFERGAHWRINSVWHEANKEIPIPFSPILVEHDDGRFSVNMVGGNMKSCHDCRELTAEEKERLLKIMYMQESLNDNQYHKLLEQE